MLKVLVLLALLAMITITATHAAEPDRSFIAGSDKQDKLRKEYAQLGGAAPAPDNAATTLWYRQPAALWVEALPLGDGRLGAMVYGGVVYERLALNEDTLWDGYPHDNANPKSLKALPEIRKLLFDGKNDAATKLAGENMMGVPPHVKSYQPLGNLLLDFPVISGAINYRRTLDVSTGIATVTYEADGAKYKREYFISEAYDFMVVRLTCDKPGKISVAATLTREKDSKTFKDPKGDDLILEGEINCPDEKTKENRGLKFESHLLPIRIGGKTTYTDDALKIDSADIVTFILTAGTNYRDPETDLNAYCNPRRTLHKGDGGLVPSYAELRKSHIKAHQELFNRVSLNLGSAGDDVEKLPTDERLARVRAGKQDPGLAALYFQFGRYLLMSCSRPGDMPANLQGLWSWQMNAPWNADYHTNINIQMNYWPAEVCNLSECHLPLFDLMDSLVKSGEHTAKVQYGANGWVVHHLTDPFGFTAPADGIQGIWPMGAAWLAQHPYEHYLFTQDKDFLAKRAYPLMKGAARFILDTLVEAPANTPVAGKLVTSPSVSPENTFIKADGTRAQFSYGVTMDLEIVHDLLTNCVEACTILDTDKDFRAECEAALKKLAPLQISKNDGRLQEWIEDYKETEPHHRHVSHLFALAPGREITVATTPELAAAARKTLEARGDDGTGWSMAWKINFWARLHDGDHAFLLLSNLFKNCTLPNLFDTHPPFQIDGNFGATAGIAEMLLQSHARAPDNGFILDLLPALPAAWPTGNVTGLKARGNITVDLTWDNQKLTTATFTSPTAATVHLRLGETLQDIKLEAEKPFVLNTQKKKRR